MGTSGARKGYKIFSFNTTIRNPKRNTDFLRVFKKFDGNLMDDLHLYNYLFSLVQQGFYKFSKISNQIKDELDNGQLLSVDEVQQAIHDNPQATGLSGRVMTQLRALKDQGFLSFVKDPKTHRYRISITKLGNQLLDGVTDPTLVYTKAMIGAEANSPIRTSILNESVPFLNTIFVINGVNKKWAELGNEPKGILRHEFSAFVLSMKDCNYQKAVDDIISYRRQFRYEINEKYIQNYLQNEGILPLKMDTILTYGEEVFRKFAMTSLLVQHGAFSYIYIAFSDYNMEKVKALLDYYQNYYYQKYKDQDQYDDALAKVYIPWEHNETIRRRIVEAKAAQLMIKLPANQTLEQQEEYLDRLFYSQALAKKIQQTDIKTIVRELLILSGTIDEKSDFDDIGEPLRLEYLLALLLGKQYGVKGLVSNIIYDEDGLPLHHAPANTPDIIYHDEDGSYIFEPTMQSGRSQQLNSETTNVVRHCEEEKAKTGLEYRVAMVAPKVHPDVSDYFRYSITSHEVKIVPLSIDCATDTIYHSNNIKNLNSAFDSLVDQLKLMKSSDFADNQNSHHFPDGFVKSFETSIGQAMRKIEKAVEKSEQ